MIKVIENAIPLSFQDRIEASAANLNYVYRANTSYFTNTDPDKDDHLEQWSHDPVIKNYLNIRRSDKNIVDNGQFSHVILEHSQLYSTHFGIVSPILYMFADKAGLEVNEITRIRLNLIVRDKTYQKDWYNSPHVDDSGKYSFVYYINDNNGDTVLFNEYKSFTDQVLFDKFTVAERVTPKKGTGVFLESNRYHASSCPSDSPIRLVINFNFR